MIGWMVNSNQSSNRLLISQVNPGVKSLMNKGLRVIESFEFIVKSIQLFENKFDKFQLLFLISY